MFFAICLFQAEVLEFNAERNTLKLQFGGTSKKYEIYSNLVLKVGTSITSADGLSSAQIEEVCVCVCVHAQIQERERERERERE